MSRRAFLNLHNPSQLESHDVVLKQSFDDIHLDSDGNPHLEKINTNITSTNTKLDTIATNTANIKISTDSVNLNVDTLESLIGSSNTKLDHLSDNMDHLSSNLDTIEGSLDVLGNIDGELEGMTPLLTAANVNTAHISDNLDHLSSDVDTVNVNLVALEASLTSMEGKMDVDNAVLDIHTGHLSEIEGAVEALEACVGSNKVNVNIASVGAGSISTEAKQDALIAANHTDLVALEASLTSMEGKMDTDNVVYDNQLTKLTEIDTAIDTIDSVLDSSLVKQGEIETSLNSLIAANHTDLVALEASLSSMEGKMDTDNVVYDNQLTKLTEIDTAIDTIDSVLDSSLVKQGEIETSLNSLIAANHTDIVNTKDRIDVHGGVNNTNLLHLSDNLDHLSSDVDTVNVNLVALEASLTSMEGKMDVDNVVYDNQLTKLGEIDTAIDTIDGVLDASLVKQTNLETLLTAANVDHAANEALLITVDQKLGDIETAVQGTITVDGTVTANLSATDNAVLDAMVVDLAALEVLQTSTNSLLTTLDGVQDNVLVKLGEIDTAIDTIDSVLDASLVKQTNIETLITTLDGVQDNVLTKLGEIETTNNANQVLLGTIDEDTNAIKVSAAALVVDAAANEVLLTSILAKNSEIEVTNNANQVLLTGIDGDTNAMKIDLAALEVLQTSILAKLAPVKTTQVLFNAVSIADGANSTSSAIDMSVAKHIGFFGFDTAGASAAIDLLACDTSDGTYSGIQSGTYQSGVASIGSLSDTPFKFLKIKISNSSGSSNDFTLRAAIST